MNQKKRVKKYLEENGQSHYKKISEQLSIFEPNVRRILGQGAKEGTFERVDKGIYVLTSFDGKKKAYIECGAAQESLARMVAEGRKFDMVFLDPAYYSKALIGGSRGIKDYGFIMPEEFEKVIRCVRHLVYDDTHVYVMLSGARTAKQDMQKYVDAVTNSGFSLIDEGGYQKVFSNGNPVTNVSGEIAKPERVILFTLSGKARACDVPICLDFKYLRPSTLNTYQTEKPLGFLTELIEQSTFIGEHVLDSFAGSGVTGEAALKIDRNVTLIEMNPNVVKNIILPRIKQTLGLQI